MIRMSHPDPNGPPDHTLIKTGEIWENPVNRERLTILERPWDNSEGRATFEMTVVNESRRCDFLYTFSSRNRPKQGSLPAEGDLRKVHNPRVGTVPRFKETPCPVLPT